jgi:hypothetical protein
VNRSVAATVTTSIEVTDVWANPRVPQAAAAFRRSPRWCWNARLPRNLHGQDSADQRRQPNEQKPSRLLGARKYL